MGISNEAAYLYVYSKELLKINRKLKRASKKAEKAFKKFKESKTVEEQIKRKPQYEETLDEVHKLQKEHNYIIRTLRHHQVAFAHQLQNQHKV